jgi:hypothetical protein
MIEVTTSMIFYLCPKCFELREGDSEDHPHGMIRFDASRFTDEERKPIFDEKGKLLTHAPAWFLHAIEERRARS